MVVSGQIDETELDVCTVSTFNDYVYSGDVSHADEEDVGKQYKVCNAFILFNVFFLLFTYI